MVNPSTAYVPDRGHVIWINFDPQTGHEQAGRRPALVLSPGAYNGRVGLAVMCPITGKAKGYGLEVTVPAGLSVSGVVLADHIKNLDWRVRRAEYICALSDETVAEVLDKLLSLLTG